jgi:hypothetical protein
MCEILAFPCVPASNHTETPRGPAEVMIFPGVRMEHREFTALEVMRLSPTPTKPQRRRRRHPLLDQNEA